jgi:hypothetical protein
LNCPTGGRIAVYSVGTKETNDTEKAPMKAPAIGTWLRVFSIAIVAATTDQLFADNKLAERFTYVHQEIAVQPG